MKTKRKEYPWLTKSVSRHGTISWRFRKDGVDAYIKHLYGSTAFVQEYQALLNGSKVVVKTAAVGSIDWVCIEYLSSSDFKNLRASTKKTKIRRIARLRKKYGHLDLRTLEPRHVKKMHDQPYETPEAANGQLKLLRQLVKLAMFHGVLKSDPTVGVKLFKSSDVGFYTWTEEDIAKFEDFHGAKSKETFALRLVINSGAARSDVSKLGALTRYVKDAYNTRVLKPINWLICGNCPNLKRSLPILTKVRNILSATAMIRNINLRLLEIGSKQLH